MKKHGFAKRQNFVLGEPSGDVPDRVREVIARQQADSEILIAWFQLAVVVTFGMLYAVSPKTCRASFRPRSPSKSLNPRTASAPAMARSEYAQS